MKRLPLIHFLLLILVTSCIEPLKIPESSPSESFLSGDGVFIINEGNFRWGNGSLSYYSYDSLKIHNDIFMSINKRPLGDVPNSMVISGEKAFIIVNNSGTIEVVDRKTLKSITTIPGLKSPRNMGVIDVDKAYVTSMYSDSVIVLDLKNNMVSGFIDIGRSSESIIVTGNRAYISSWIGDKFITVINTVNNQIISAIEVGMEPESMVLDKNGKLWVLCNGGWARTKNAELDKININLLSVEKRMVFPSISDSPGSLQINGKGDSLFFILDGIRSLNIDSDRLPAGPFIQQTDHYFYKLGINPKNGDIIATDAVDYQKKGYILIYSRKGLFQRSFETGIIPGSMYFKLQTGPSTI